MPVVRKAVVQGGETVGIILFDTDDPIQPPAGQTFVDESAAPPWRVDTEGVAQGAVLVRLNSAVDALATVASTPDVVTFPAGTLTAAQLSDAVRALRAAVQQNRVGIRAVARAAKRLVLFVRGQFSADTDDV